MSKKPLQKVSEAEQELTSKLFLIYRKKCEMSGIQVSSFIRQKLERANQQGILEHFQTSQQMGSNQARAFIQALYELKYQRLKTLRIWKAEFNDQGVRIISKYMLGENCLQVLDLLDNNITSLGCEFLGKSLLNPQSKIRQIKLDNNPIGTQGLKNLAIGLRTIESLDKLSLKYCNIDSKGARYVQQIIANIKSKLRSIKLQGNPLQNQGIYQVLKAVRTCGETIEKINIADVKMNLLGYNKQEENKIQKKIKYEMVNILKNNIMIIKFECRFNQIHNEIAQEMLSIVENSKNIKKIEFPNNVKYELRDSLDAIIRGRNKKPKKKQTKQ